MRKLRVDFNQAIGDVVFARIHDGSLAVGGSVAVYDLDTEAFAATVVGSRPPAPRCSSTSARFSRLPEISQA